MRYTVVTEYEERYRRMKRNFIRSALLILLVALLMSVVGCGKGDDRDIPENMQYATPEGALYRLFIPVDWNLMDAMGSSGGYASAHNYAAVFVHDYENPDGLSAKEYAEQVYLGEIRAVYPSAELGVVALSDTVLGGKAAVMMEYAGTRDLVTYRTRELICVYGDRVYVLTFAAQMDLFEGYLSVYDSVTANFKFTDVPFVPDEPVNTVKPDAEAPAGMMLASNDDVAYRFYVPDTWVLDRALPTSSAYASDTDRSNVNVTVYMPEVDQMTAEEYWALCEAEYVGVMQDYTLLSTTTGSLDGRPSNTYIYTAGVGGTAYRFAQTVATYRGMVYTVTYTALDEAFDRHAEAYEQILAAFDFRGN